jgi:hypothetical protein
LIKLLSILYWYLVSHAKKFYLLKLLSFMLSDANTVKHITHWGRSSPFIKVLVNPRGKFYYCYLMLKTEEVIKYMREYFYTYSKPKRLISNRSTNCVYFERFQNISVLLVCRTNINCDRYNQGKREGGSSKSFDNTDDSENRGTFR